MHQKYLPIFPLNIVLFPESRAFLKIFEPRYLRMVGESIKNKTPFVIVKSRKDKNYKEITGTLANIVSWESDQQGGLNILIKGRERVMLGDSYLEDDNLRLSRVHVMSEKDEIKVPERFQCLSKLLEEIYEKIEGDKEYYNFQLDNASWLSYRLGELVNLSIDLKQDILQTDNPVKRLEKIYDGIFQYVEHAEQSHKTLQ